MKRIIRISLGLFIGYACSLPLQSCFDCNRLTYRLRSLITQCKKVGQIARQDSIQTEIVDYVYLPDISGIRYDSLGIEVRHHLVRVSKGDACDEPIVFDKSKRVIITSSEDYTSDLPKGSNLVNTMAVADYPYFKFEKIETFMANRELGFSSFLYTFQSPPSEDKFHNLTIKYILTNARQYSATIENVLIKK